MNTDYIRVTPDGMGTWLAVFGNNGDVVAAISKRPDLHPIYDILAQYGDEIFEKADSIAIEIDIDKDIVKLVFALAEKHNKPVYAVVSNMRIAFERRDFCAPRSASYAISRRRAFFSATITMIRHRPRWRIYYPAA